ncbi:MAG: nitrous oxide reductase accessory protein NosL [Gammaproteobacteria bacterium]|nr:nitrous oxide reductase accessory protein NosL [Gammaproteobacteria bacterium]
MLEVKAVSMFSAGRVGRVLGLSMALLLLATTGAGCSEQSTTTESLPPVAIDQGDECHVCGMIIKRFPGPKGEVFSRHHEEALKFCSTTDMFSYLLQPEAKAAVQQVYVHDMGATDWQQPDDSALIDAQSAWYVVGHSLQGAMGETLASFKTEASAQKFAEEHGGRVIAYTDVTLELLANLNSGGMKMDSHNGDGMKMDSASDEGMEMDSDSDEGMKMDSPSDHSM